MSEIIAIICEYNPFHSGHKIQINKIKESFPKSKIIAIMSGNCTQRAELAIMDKYSRAEAAVICGVDAVFEIPYPYSSSNAEVFAKAGVYIASSLGATHLCFGSETGEIDYLKDIADTIDSENFANAISLALKEKGISYPRAREKALIKLGKSIPNTPNDILGVEYLRAIKSIDSSIIPIVIKRKGSSYKDYEISDIMSAGAIRKFFYKKGKFISVPEDVLDVYKREQNEGKILNEEALDDFIHKYLLLAIADDFETIYDTLPGMSHFILNVAKEASSGKEFFEKLTSKSYTHSRLRRVIFYMMFKVKKIEEMPSYTTLLSSNSCGRVIVKNAKKANKINILTKVANYKKLDPVSINQAEMSLKMDKFHISFMRSPSVQNDVFKKQPFLKK
ncbi:MAG: nucleotidyltransferase family protein [Clostridia bacterium]|nr:nucleotidyltransferase family protein [Clostridia bacterium]